MKKFNYLLVFPALFYLSCKKNSFTNPQLASLLVANTIINGNAVKVGNNLKIINNNSSFSLAVTTDNDDLNVWPVDDSLHPYYTISKIAVEDRASYSLFLGGTPTAVDGILVKDVIPYHTDSTCGVRFVNLSPNGGAFNITLSTSPAVNEVSNLIYKQLTDFKIYPGKASNPRYLFQIRNATDNTLLFTYTLTTPRFSNVTLVIRGLVGSTPAIGVTRVNLDR